MDRAFDITSSAVENRDLLLSSITIGDKHSLAVVFSPVGDENSPMMQTAVNFEWEGCGKANCKVAGHGVHLHTIAPYLCESKIYSLLLHLSKRATSDKNYPLPVKFESS